MRFLTGLNEQYSAGKSQILLVERFPSLTRARSMILQRERQFGVNVDDAQLSANATDGRRFNSGYGRGKSKRLCTFCGKSGHTVDYCYSKHGHPDDVKYKNKSVNSAEAGADDHNNEEKFYL